MVVEIVSRINMDEKNKIFAKRLKRQRSNGLMCLWDEILGKKENGLLGSDLYSPFGAIHPFFSSCVPPEARKK